MDMLRRQQQEFDEKFKTFEQVKNEVNEEEIKEKDEEQEFTKAREQANSNIILLGSAENLKRCSLQKLDLKQKLSIIEKQIADNSKQLGVYMKSNNIPFFDEQTSNNKIVLETNTKLKPLTKSEIKKRFIDIFGEIHGPKYYDMIYKPSNESVTMTKVLYKTEEEIKREERKKNKHLKMTQKYNKFLECIAASNFNTKGFEQEEKEKLKQQLILALQNIE